MFLDEFSMVKPALYSLTNSRLQKMKARLDKPFGGVHLVFTGDFYQLQPVGSFIFQTPTQFENDKDSNAKESMKGRHLWKTQLTDVIELTENHRQTSDPEWADALERWRINQPTREDIERVDMWAIWTRLCNVRPLRLSSPSVKMTTKKQECGISKDVSMMPLAASVQETLTGENVASSW